MSPLGAYILGVLTIPAAVVLWYAGQGWALVFKALRDDLRRCDRCDR